MDIKTLAVGQKIWIRSGEHTKEVIITEITDESIDVAAAPLAVGEERRCFTMLIKFDKTGKKQLGSSAAGLNGWDPRPLCVGLVPWEIAE